MVTLNTNMLAVIFVLYKDYGAMREFLNGQPNGVPDNVQLYIVDNTPHKEVNEEILQEFRVLPNVEVVVANPENLGYSGAANFAVSHYPILKDFNFIAISNTDLKFDLSSIVRNLELGHKNYSNVGAIAPQLCHQDGSRKPQLHYITAPSRKKYERLCFVFSYYYLTICHRVMGDFKRALGFSRSGSDEIPHELFAPHGALIFFTKQYFEETAGFDYPSFLFCEEIFFGDECRKAGLLVVYEPNLQYSHENHGTMGYFPSRTIVNHLRDSHREVLRMLE